MTGWEITHGQVVGAYQRIDGHELYAREGGRGHPDGQWLWFVDGQCCGAERNELAARAAAEAFVGPMGRTHTGRMAASAA